MGRALFGRRAKDAAACFVASLQRQGEDQRVAWNPSSTNGTQPPISSKRGDIGAHRACVQPIVSVQHRANEVRRGRALLLLEDFANVAGDAFALRGLLVFVLKHANFAVHFAELSEELATTSSEGLEW